MARHQDLLYNHILESWIFANAAARLAAGSYVSGDLGRIGYQTDTKTYWRLTATTPTWQVLRPSSASLQTASNDPSATASTTKVMMGLGDAGAVMTPIATGKVLITVTGSILNQSADKFSEATLYRGTGTPPVNGAALTGTTTGAIATKSGTLAASSTVPFSLAAVVTGLAIGTQIWIDVALKTESTGTAQISGVTVAAVELP